MKKLFLFAALFAAAAFSSCSKHDNVEPVVVPEPQPLAIAFAEGNSLEFDVDETKIVHYTITGGSANNVVKAEMQTPDDAYTVETTPISATEGTIAITAKTPETENCVLVTVSDGDRSITTEIAVALKASFDGKTVVVATPGTVSQLLADYDITQITELTVIGNLNDEDIATLKNLPKLTVLDMENVNLEELPYQAFRDKTLLTSIKLPKTLKTIGDYAFCDCSGLTSVTISDGAMSIGRHAFTACTKLRSIMIPNSVTSFGEYAFCRCGLTSVTIPNSMTSIGDSVFWYCNKLTRITISDSVTEIGKTAFGGCTILVNITIPDSVMSIGDSVFYSCSRLANIYCMAITPPSAETAFRSVNISAITLYVPAGSAEAYRVAEGWKEFINIVEMEF